MSVIADRIRTARETWVPSGGRKWLIRRPTRLQLVDHAQTPRELVFFCVVGWELKELDLVPGGGGLPVIFDPEAFREWAEDEIELLTELAAKIEEIIQAHNRKREELQKN